MRHSLRLTLLGWVLLPLAVAVAVDSWVTYRNAVDTASVVQDRLLLGSARSIAEQIHFEDGSFQNQIPPAALELFQSTESDHIYYRVTTGAGRLLAGYTDLIRPDVSPPAKSPYFFDGSMRGAPVRIVAFLQPVIGDPNTKPVMVEVAQTRFGHQQLTNKLWTHAVLGQLLILALASALVLLGLNRGLRPVMRLRERVNAREPGTLKPMSANDIPIELIPLVDSLNDYIRRLEVHAGAQDVFIQNAAHQLRTPVALLNTQLSYAQRTTDVSERTESVGAAYRTLQQMMRLLNQLLALSTAQSFAAGADSVGAEALNLAALVQDVFENLVAQAQRKDIKLGFDTFGEHPVIYFNPMVVREILMNLVDNAIRYTPVGGSVTVRIDSQGARTVLSVQDNGEGIPAALREKVFERFFRVHNTDSNGSGLGLAIVREFATKMGAQVHLSDPPSGKGLLVRLTFPEKIDR